MYFVLILEARHLRISSNQEVYSLSAPRYSCNCRFFAFSLFWWLFGISISGYITSTSAYGHFPNFSSMCPSFFLASFIRVLVIALRAFKANPGHFHFNIINVITFSVTNINCEGLELRVIGTTFESNTIDKEENYNTVDFRVKHCTRHADSERKEILCNERATIFN